MCYLQIWLKTRGSSPSHCPDRAPYVLSHEAVMSRMWHMLYFIFYTIKHPSSDSPSLPPLSSMEWSLKKASSVSFTGFCHQKIIIINSYRALVSARHIISTRNLLTQSSQQHNEMVTIIISIVQMWKWRPCAFSPYASPNSSINCHFD